MACFHTLLDRKELIMAHEVHERKLSKVVKQFFKGDSEDAQNRLKK